MYHMIKYKLEIDGREIIILRKKGDVTKLPINCTTNYEKLSSAISLLMGFEWK